MTRNKLEKMAKAAKIFDLYGEQAKQRTTFLLSEKELKRFQDFLEALEKFAGLVAAHEREECIKAVQRCHLYVDGSHGVDESNWHIVNRMIEHCVDAIEARGQG